VVGSGPTAHWLPWPGKHPIELSDTTGQVIDLVRIEGRGAGVAAKAQRRS
jgi:penicillin-binding protein 1C